MENIDFNEEQKKFLSDRTKIYNQTRKINQELFDEEMRKFLSERRRVYHKKYYDTNYDKISEYSKQYRKDNREYFNMKFNCECGGKYTRTSKSVHVKSLKHQNYLKTTL
jgi:hypothetical protein